MTAFAYCPKDGTRLVPTRIDGRDRPGCPTCGFADFLHVQIGANAVVQQDGQVLLVRLSYGPRIGRWALPGGLCEQEESPEDAAIREIEEETGLQTEIEGLLSVFRRTTGPILVVTYRARIVGGDLRIAPEEVSEAAFFPADELPPVEEIAWPSHIHGLDAWRAFERARA